MIWEQQAHQKGQVPLDRGLVTSEEYDKMMERKTAKKWGT
jgi:hypothetical protein